MKKGFKIRGAELCIVITLRDAALHETQRSFTDTFKGQLDLVDGQMKAGGMEQRRPSPSVPLDLLVPAGGRAEIMAGCSSVGGTQGGRMGFFFLVQVPAADVTGAFQKTAEAQRLRAASSPSA